MKRISKSLNFNWKLKYLHHDDYLKLNFQVTNINEFKKINSTEYSAVVPGNFELDLQRTNAFCDLFVADNILEAQKYEDCHLFYCCKFEYNSVDNMISYINFEGIDTFSHIYLNGTLIAKTDNMFISHLLKCNNLLEGENELLVHILPTIIEAYKNEIAVGDLAMKYNYPSLTVRKAAHSFGWDIMPRLLSGGIWRDVSLLQLPEIHIDELYLYTTWVDFDNSHANICLFYSLNLNEQMPYNFRLEIDGICEDSNFHSETELWFNKGRLDANVDNAKLWWPKGRGKQNLYNVSVRLYYNNILFDEKTIRFGIRIIELIKSSITDKEGSGEFYFKINNQKIFILGTNWVPADAFHSKDKERIPKILELVDDIGCNTIRCWGGNVYEDNTFYDICDEKGFIVWQDFAMGCATYPQNLEMQRKMEVEVISIVKKLRQHPSLCLWAGDNECDYAYNFAPPKRNPNGNILTRKIIPDLLYSHDPFRPYLPSSPFIDDISYIKGVEYIPEDHLWGPRDYYKSVYYTGSLAHFASEIGYHGSPSPDSIKKFISKDKLWPWENNLEWILHSSSPETSLKTDWAARIKLMANQIKVIFESEPVNLCEFSLASQISQAQAMKFFIEMFRIAKWRKTGIIWWNIIDGWPQFSDAVVDYYFTKKLAYHFIKQSQQLVCVMAENKNGMINFFAVNDTPGDVELIINIYDKTAGSKSIKEIKVTVTADTTSLIYSMPDLDEQRFFIMEWVYEGKINNNHFLSGKTRYSLTKLIDFYSENNLLLLEGFSDSELPQSNIN